MCRYIMQQGHHNRVFSGKKNNLTPSPGLDRVNVSKNLGKALPLITPLCKKFRKIMLNRISKSKLRTGLLAHKIL